MMELERTIKALEICALGKTCVSCPLTEECKGLSNAAMARAAKLLKDGNRVRVVRCAECHYWEPENNEEFATSGHCRRSFGICYGQITDASWFCADGEREG